MNTSFNTSNGDKVKEKELSTGIIIPFSAWNGKILVWLKHICYTNIYMFLRAYHFTDPVSKGTNIKSMKRKLWGTLCL